MEQYPKFNKNVTKTSIVGSTSRALTSGVMAKPIAMKNETIVKPATKFFASEFAFDIK